MIIPEQGIVIAGRYELVRELARGGMGSVWIAYHRDLDLQVTVKFMAPALVASPDARTRFEREARVAARLRSQHVVQVHDYGVKDCTPYIVMELLEGESLHARLVRQKRLPLPVAAQMALQICTALRTAHEAGLVHRDLKPANVFLAIKDHDEVVKILDFGVAKVEGVGDASADTASGMLLGSAHYMSPEQIRSSRRVDHRSDLWSVGVLLYRMLTGVLPFPGAKLGDVLVRVCTDPPLPPSSVDSTLPLWIDGFFARALARDPDARFQSAMALAEALFFVAPRAPAKETLPAQSWKTTLPMGTALASVAVGSCGVASARSATIRHALGPSPQVYTGDNQRITDASSRVGAGSITAVLVAEVPRASSPQPGQPSARGAGAGRPVSWPVRAAVALVLVATLSLVLRFVASYGGTTTVAGPSVGQPFPVVATTVILPDPPPKTVATAEPSPSGAPAVIVAPSGAAPVSPSPPRRAGDIFRGDPYADAGLVDATIPEPPRPLKRAPKQEADPYEEQ